MLKTITNFILNSQLFKKPMPHHLGRWNLNNKKYLKVDYANMDSCGDTICGKPDHFKKKSNCKKL